jgi:membrane-bound metal-dependent hydrolase YbcI (DUF457 family)
MMGKQHVLSGVVVGLATCHTVSGFAAGAVWVFLVAAGSLAPDLDHPSARAVRSLGLPGKVLSLGVVALSRAVFRLVRGPRDGGDGGHRYLTHTLASVPSVGLLVAGLVAVPRLVFGGAVWGVLPGPWEWGAAFALGWLTHIVGDAVTKGGCPLLWPVMIGGRRWHRLRLPGWVAFRTGGWFERWIVRTALLILVAVLAVGLVTGIS